MRSPSKRARRWAAGCAAARCRRPTTMCLRTVTSLPTDGSARPASTGMRSPTGAGPAASACTTWVTGTAASGGAPGRERTATSGRRDGGISSIPTHMRKLWKNGGFPVADFEQLDAHAMHTEDVMLRLRLRRGLAADSLSDRERERAANRHRRRLAGHRRRPAGAHRSWPASGRRRRAHRARLIHAVVERFPRCVSYSQGSSQQMQRARAEHDST